MGIQLYVHEENCQLSKFDNEINRLLLNDIWSMLELYYQLSEASGEMKLYDNVRNHSKFPVCQRKII